MIEMFSYNERPPLDISRIVFKLNANVIKDHFQNKVSVNY